jgi:hypothetical protein
VPRPRNEPRLRRLDAARLDLVEDVLELVAEEDRDDRRRRLVGAEAVVLAGDATDARSRPPYL